ncbi:MAG: DEAD/DEAH box helicase [Spirochaetota bacterium]
MPYDQAALSLNPAFGGLDLSPWLLKALSESGCEAPFPVQAAVIPAALAGQDLCVSAATGSGKTLAFALPILERLGRAASHGAGRDGLVKALIIVPTRELAVQVGAVIKALAHGAAQEVVIRVVHGGGSVNPDMLALRGGADILVATPGRLLDLASRNAARLSRVGYLVLDEADRMLSLGFRDELAAILALLPKERQTLLFSATIGQEVEAIAARELRSEASPPLRIAIEGLPLRAEVPDAGLTEILHVVPADSKGPFLRKLIEGRPDLERILVFASSNRRADNVTRKLVNNGISAIAFHGDLSQASRTEALSEFRGAGVRVLVASDLASRGLDIGGLPCVINYELPRQPLDYIHRIGRTGRAGSPGLAITLICPEEEGQLRIIEKRIGRRLPRA